MYSAVRHIFPIFCLKFRVLSIVILANSASSDSLMLIDPTFRLNLKYFFHPKIINQNFLGLRQLIELILNQQRRFFILCSFYTKPKVVWCQKCLNERFSQRKILSHRYENLKHICGKHYQSNVSALFFSSCKTKGF